MNYRFLLFISILFINCNSNKSTHLDNNNKNKIEDKLNASSINRVWMLVQFNDFTKEYLIQKKATVDLTNSNRMTANMGCNSISFQYEIKSKKEILFSKGIMTEMACEDMKLESEFASQLPQYTTFIIEGHKLSLLTSSGNKMIFIAQDWD